MAVTAAAVVITILRRLEAKRRGVKRGESGVEDEERVSSSMRGLMVCLSSSSLAMTEQTLLDVSTPRTGRRAITLKGCITDKHSCQIQLPNSAL